jgi:hypothetical protein
MTTDHSAIRDDADQHRSRLRRAYSAVACLVFGTAFMVPSAASAQATAIHPHAPARDGHRISRPVPKASRHAVARIAAVVSPAGASCQPVELVTFRGSAENDAKYHNGEGVMLGKLIDAAKAYPLKDGYSSADVPVYGVPYPAVGLDQYISADKTDLFDSVSATSRLATQRVQALALSCSGTRRGSPSRATLRRTSPQM